MVSLLVVEELDVIEDRIYYLNPSFPSLADDLI